jgi:hypothetical protein
MAASYPASIKSFRTKANKSGVVYDVDKTTVLFVEDFSAIEDEVVAIETELEAHVWNDIFVPLAGAKVPPANFPTWAVFLANLNSYTFNVNDYADLATAEILHGYKEGTDIKLHVHLVTNGLNDATVRKAKYTVYYSWGDNGEVMSAEGSKTAEVTIAAALADKTHLLLDLGSIAGVGYKINSILKLRIKRVAGTGTEPAADPFVEMVGVHYQADFIGSEGELVK